MSEKIPARFRKTKTDKWAVMAPVEDLEKALAGDGTIEVLKRSGDTSTFTVGSLGRPFDVDGVKMCYGYAPGDDDGGPGGDAESDRPDDGRPGRPVERGPGQRRPAADFSRGSGARSGPGPGPAGHRSVEPPARDETEPLPEYRGGPDDEWDPGYR